jgi:hypothetical protein
MAAVVQALTQGRVRAPTDDPDERWVQIAMLHGRRIVQAFWDRHCPVELDFQHRTDGKRFVAQGEGLWFPPLYSSEAFIWCVIPVAEARDHQDYKPIYGSLNALAEWAHRTARPGGGDAWRNTGISA